MLMHFVANGHNDILLALFSCLAIFFFVTGRYMLVPLTCIAGLGIKWLSLPLFIGLSILLYRKTTKANFIKSQLLAILPIVALTSYYYSGVDVAHFEALLQNIGIHAGSFRSLIELMNIPYLESLFVSVTSGMLLVCTGIFVWRWLFPNPDKDQLDVVLSDSIVLIALYTCLVSARLTGWSIALFAPMAFVLPSESKVYRFSLAILCLMLFSLLWFGYTNPLFAPTFVWASYMVARIYGVGEQANLQAENADATHECGTTGDNKLIQES